MTRTLILISAFALTTLGCGGDGGEGADPGAGDTGAADATTDTGTGADAGAGGDVEEGSIDAENGAAVSAMMAALSSVDFDANGLAGGSQKQADPNDPNCSPNGEPYDGAGNPLSPADEGFGAVSGYCSAIYNTWSPDSALGGMAIASILTCLVGEAEGFSAATVDGATVDVEFGPSFVGDTTCYTAEDIGPDRLNIPGDIQAPVTVTDVSATTAFDYKLSYTTAGSETLYLRTSTTELAARSESDNGVWQFDHAVDGGTGTIRYENVDTRFRRIRVIATGAVSEGFNLDSVTEVLGWNLEFSGVSDEPAWSTFTTFWHVPEDGTVENVYTLGETGAFEAVRESSCHPSEFPCSAPRASLTRDFTQIDELFTTTSDASDAYRGDAVGVLSFDADPTSAGDNILTPVLSL